MTIGIYVFGHGGGVPMGNAGNTNFAIIPELKPGSTPENVLQTNRYWLLDVGPETMLRITGCLGDEPSTHNLEGILLTHLHADHAGGIPSLAWRFRFADKRAPFLWVPGDLHGLLEHQTVELTYDNPRNKTILGYPTLRTFFDYGHWPVGYDHRASSGMKFQFFPVDHNICGDYSFEEGDQPFPAFGVQITLGDKKVTFSGDTAKVIDPHWFTSSDLVFHDVQLYNPGDGYHVHCPYSELRDAVKPEGRSKVYVSHTLVEPARSTFEDGFKWASKGSLITL